jgi:hypothetical protein
MPTKKLKQAKKLRATKPLKFNAIANGSGGGSGKV